MSNYSRFTGFTPLMRSVNIGNEEITQILLKKGANANAVNDIGDSALNLATKNSKNIHIFVIIETSNNIKPTKICFLYIDHVEIMKMLIEYGADVNHKAANGKSSLIIVAGQGKPKRMSFPHSFLIKYFHIQIIREETFIDAKRFLALKKLVCKMCILRGCEL